MDMIKVSILGIVAVCLSLFLQNEKQHVGVYIAIIASVIIFAGVLTKVDEIKELIEEIKSYLNLSGVYLETLLKMIGITYLAEFSSNICKDAGSTAIASQIELFAKLSVLVLSMPIVLSILETIRTFLI